MAALTENAKQNNGDMKNFFIRDPFCWRGWKDILLFFSYQKIIIAVNIKEERVSVSKELNTENFNYSNMKPRFCDKI